MSIARPVTRIAPSPTGFLHIGTARTALFNYLFARQHEGTFVLRIEDTDRARSTHEFETNILEGLERLGLGWDKLVRQSERAELHTKALKQLIDTDKAFVSAEPAKDDSSRTVEVVRLRNPGTTVTFTDIVRGDISFDTTELGDFVIARSLNDPLYHLAVVVDDADMGITHVIRGEDHISNTPRQILLQEALGFERPTYTHLPLILAPDRSKMSKRKGAVSISEYLEQGFLPETLLNYLALLGWNPGTDQEVFTLEALVATFSLEQVQKGGAVFDIEKLKWLNREHRKLRPDEEERAHILSALAPYPSLQERVSASPAAYTDLKERYTTTAELCTAVEAGEYQFYTGTPTLDMEQLHWKKDPVAAHTRERLTHVQELLRTIDQKDFQYEILKDLIWPYAESEGKGEVLWPLRYALSAATRSPDPFVLLEALGKEEALDRISRAIALLEP